MKAQKKVYCRRRIVICIILLLISIVAVKGIRSFSGDVPAMMSSSPGNNKEVSYENIKINTDQIKRGELILVNNKTHYTFEKNDKLTSVFDLKTNSYQIKDKNVLLNKDIMPQLNTMLDAFHAAKGTNDLMVISGYRTKEIQAQLMKEKVQEVGKQEAEKWVATPGGSEHHTGFAIDFGIYTKSGRTENYTGQGKYRWVNENCKNYGFVVRYPDEKSDLTGISYEPWHFRYVGIPHATAMTDLGLCMEEYIDYLKQFSFDKEHLQVSAGGKSHEIYYVEATGSKTKVPVPKNRDYTLSGNNLDGFIITVSLT